ncbi:hypothetical protein ZHAS_00014110 [Anopheles sinensis]|uniref:Uncharacterized protein n=1 Tax=Anopheles sinensis TaxID=74873 RepID=A0A084W768_ANOSI|nr:hypothetical protein ZHAS_00014110 [Anopheles sinensis]
MVNVSFRFLHFCRENATESWLADHSERESENERIPAGLIDADRKTFPTKARQSGAIIRLIAAGINGLVEG